MRRVQVPYLGWSGIEVVRVGVPGEPRCRVDLGFDAEGIRNCSRALDVDRIGVSARDRADGARVVAIVEPGGPARIVLRREQILHQSLDPRGATLCVTLPAPSRPVADLYLLDIESCDLRPLLEGGASQAAVPQWFPDSRRIVFEAPDGRVLVVQADDGRVEAEAIGRGTSPCVSPDGQWMALRRDGRILVGRLAARDFAPLGLPWRDRRRAGAGGLSWSRDGSRLSFGVVAGYVGKRARFSAIEVSTARCTRIPERYLSGLVLL